MRFTKMNGAGNDFLILNNLEERLPAEDFPRPLFQMDTDFWLPWVLEEENPDGA